MQSPAIEHSAAFGQRTFNIFTALQLDGLACLQKLGELNLAAMKATVTESRNALSGGLSTAAPFAGASDAQQQLVQRTLSYAQHVKEIDAQFIAALTKAGESLREEFGASVAQFGSGFGQTTPFSSDSAFGAMQSVMASMIHSGNVMQDSIKRASGVMAGTAIAATDDAAR
ncbi:phasin family protein [Paraburkholderia sp.]|uniref:phasin family protein n=1 Tax=Paraburkholderia sp. TaxID=1926495 RepID=UPI002D2B358F|nr:phasin family protein [Paraburkholderia sp.]HZZ03735.1 phasin family protein [Paraburkholderia sp.]